MLYPQYDFLGQFLSALGTSEWGFLFNTAVIIIGISTFLFYGTIIHQFIHKTIKMSYLVLVASTLGSFSGILLIGVGTFVASGETSDIHDFFAIAFFIVLMIFMLLFAIGFSRTSNPLIGAQSKHGLTFLSIAIFLSTVAGLFMPAINQYLMQKLVVFLYVVFVFWLDYLLFSYQNDQYIT